MARLWTYVLGLASPSFVVGEFSLVIQVLLPDGSLSSQINTGDLPMTATSIEINNAISEAALQAYRDAGGEDVLVTTNVIGGVV